MGITGCYSVFTQYKKLCRVGLCPVQNRCLELMGSVDNDPSDVVAEPVALPVSASTLPVVNNVSRIMIE